MVEDTEKIKERERYLDRGIERKDGRRKIKKERKKKWDKKEKLHKRNK